MEHHLDFTKSFELTVAALIHQDEAMLKKYHAFVKPEYWNDPTISELMAILVYFYEEHRERPSHSTVQEMILQRHHSPRKEESLKRENLQKRYNQLTYEIDVTNRAYIEKRLVQWAQQVSYEKVTLKAVQSLRDHDSTGSEVDLSVADDFKQIASLPALLNGSQPMNLADSFHSVIYSTAESEALPTGLPHLDSIIRGGLRPGQLGVIMAPPKGAKSTFLLNFSYSALQNRMGGGCNVLYLTLEMDEATVITRCVQRVNGLTQEEIKDSPGEVSARTREVIQRQIGSNLFHVQYMPTKTCTPAFLRQYLDEMKERGVTYGLITVDYLDLMRSEGKHQSDYLEAGIVCEELRDIANTYRVPVWTACRSTRESVGQQHMNMSHMSRSFERLGVADLVIALCQTDSERLQRKMRVQIVASRNCDTSKEVICECRPDIMLVTSESARDLKTAIDQPPQKTFRRGKMGALIGSASTIDDIERKRPNRPTSVTLFPEG